MEIWKNHQISSIFWKKRILTCLILLSINWFQNVVVKYLGSVWLNILWKPLWQTDILISMIILFHVSNQSKLDHIVLLVYPIISAADLRFNFKGCATSGKAASINGTRGLRGVLSPRSQCIQSYLQPKMRLKWGKGGSGWRLGGREANYTCCQ